jgi:hypothetical protein
MAGKKFVAVNKELARTLQKNLEAGRKSRPK